MKKVTKVFSVMVASVALAAMLSGCGGDKKPAGGDTIKVGGNLEMTGGSASFGISSKNAIELAFKNINDKGGINGKKLELVVADNKSEAAEATNAMQKLVSQDKVVAVIGPNLSSATIAAGAINNGSKVLDIAPMATNPNVTVDPATKSPTGVSGQKSSRSGSVESLIYTFPSRIVTVSPGSPMTRLINFCFSSSG